MKYLQLPVLVMYMLVTSACAAQSKTDENVVLTSLAPVHQLVKALTANTPITVRNLPARPRSMAAQPTWFQRQSESEYETFVSADAAIGISRVWNQDPLFLYAREHNIRIVNVDAALPWSHERSGVALPASPVTGDTSPYFWTAISNVIRMHEIVAFDLKALFPEHAENIEKNLQSSKNRLISLKADLEADLLQVSDPFVYALTDELVAMTNELGIFVADYFVKQDIDWTQDDLTALTTALQSQQIPVVIHKWEPSEEIKKAVEAAGATLVVLNNMELVDTPLSEALEQNGEALLAGFR